MDETARAEEWIRAELQRAREAFRHQPPGPHDLTLAQYEQQLRARAAAILRPTSAYVGLRLPDAQAAAGGNGDALCVHRGPTGHRADWRADRVHVELDEQDRVRSAHRDRFPWQQES